MSELAVKLGIKARTVTQFIDGLEKEKLVERLSDPTDRRVTYVQLTVTAYPLIRRARIATRSICEKFLENLSSEQKNNLMRFCRCLIKIRIFLDKIISHL